MTVSLISNRLVMEIVEVFKTNVETDDQAKHIVNLIRENFPDYTVNFDLDDCDRILRIKSSGFISESSLLNILHNNGFYAAMLTDEIPPFIDKAIMHSV